VAVDTTLCVEWKEVKALSPLSAARPLPRLARQASFDSQDFLQVPPAQPGPAGCRCPAAERPSRPHGGLHRPPPRCPPGPASPQRLRGCSDVSREPGCILGEISPRCLVAMAMRFVARLQIPHRFPRGHGLGARRGQDGQRGHGAGRCGTAGAARERALGNAASVASHTQLPVAAPPGALLRDLLQGHLCQLGARHGSCEPESDSSHTLSPETLCSSLCSLEMVSPSELTAKLLGSLGGEDLLLPKLAPPASQSALRGLARLRCQDSLYSVSYADACLSPAEDEVVLSKDFPLRRKVSDVASSGVASLEEEEEAEE
ncbi:F131A protein, partial [Uria aalge]|nr:F131A protein [Uria aalge]